ncbi:glycosyltransferase family 2 protein [Chloroflexota bacterium]
MVEPNRPLVSVVIPCLNRAHFLVPTIESVLQQDYPNIECIVVDGVSTDGTIEVLHRYGDRITWVSEPDRGHSDAINKGWKMSQGEVLAWLNADDVWVVPNAVSEVVAYLEAHPEVDLVYGETGVIDADGNEVESIHRREWSLDFAVEHCQHVIGQPAAFIRRCILEKVGPLDTNFYQKKDHELWLRIGLVGKIQHIPVFLANIRNVQGLSFEGKTAAPACVQVTKKFYSLAGIPETLKKKRKRAMSNSYLRGMEFAFPGGRLWCIIFSYALRAAMTDRSNAYNAFRKLGLYMFISLTENRHLQQFWRIARRTRAHFR